MRRALPLALFLALGACSVPVTPAEPPIVDRDQFESEVYPVLARDCGYVGCHGDPGRFFRVYAPGRTRLDPATGTFAPATRAEIDATFERARSMLAAVATPEDSLLLRKPLDPSEGGAAHRGTDALGRDVYRNREATGWQAIARWAGAVGVAP